MSDSKPSTASEGC